MIKVLGVKSKSVSPVNVIGKKIEVISSSNPYLIGLSGKVIWETKNMLIVKTEGDIVKKVPKGVCRFKVYDEFGKTYEVDGELLIGTLDRRLKIWLKRKRGI